MKMWLAVLAAALGLLVSGKLISTYQLLARTAPNAYSQEQAADCALVLTGGAHRVREGFDLLARRNVKKLIISGVNPSATLSDIFPIFPFYGSLSEEDVVLERKSRTTFGNVQQSVPILEALKCRDLILVTSHLHMYRALRTLQSELPPQIVVLRRSVATSSMDPSFVEVAVETLKVVFYSVWAF